MTGCVTPRREGEPYRPRNLWLAYADGEATRLTDPTRPPAGAYGETWLVVRAATSRDVALALAGYRKAGFGWGVLTEPDARRAVAGESV